MTPPFTRARRARNTQDAVGRVVVSVVLHDPERHAHQRGNITRSFSFNHTRVSIIANIFEDIVKRAEDIDALTR
jgi:hypothetical protein